MSGGIEADVERVLFSARKDWLMTVGVVVISFVFPGALVYGTGCFTAATGDVTLWSQASRVVAVVAWLLVSVVVCLPAFLTLWSAVLEDQEEERKRLMQVFADQAVARTRPTKTRRFDTGQN